MSLSQGSAKCRFLCFAFLVSLSQSSAKCRFILLLFVRTFCSRLFAKFFDLRILLSVSSPPRSVGTSSLFGLVIKPGHNHEDCTYTLEHNGGVLNLRKSDKRKLVFVLHSHLHASHLEFNWKSPGSTLFRIRRYSLSFARV